MQLQLQTWVEVEGLPRIEPRHHPADRLRPSSTGPIGLIGTDAICARSSLAASVKLPERSSLRPSRSGWPASSRLSRLGDPAADDH